MARDKRGRAKGKRNSPGKGTERQRKDGRWEYIVPVGHDASGKAIKKSFYGATLAEAHESHKAWVAEHPNGPPTPQQAAPFNDLLNAYLAACVAPPFGKQGTLEDHLRKVKRHIAPTIGQQELGKIRRHEVLTWLRELFERTKAGRTTEKCLEIVNAAFEYGVSNGIITANPAHKVKAPAYERRKPQPLNPAQFRAFLEAAAGRLDRRGPVKRVWSRRVVRKQESTVKLPPLDTRLYALYVVLLYVGLRRGEVLALRWSDLVDGVLHIQRQIDDEGRKWNYTKGDENNRKVELVDLVQDALSDHTARMQLEDHEEARKPDGLMFPTKNGTAIRPRNLQRHFKSVLAAAGLPDSVRIHDLRHTTGSTAAAHGVPTAAITALLGHSSTAITQKLYIHEDSEGTKAAQEAVRKRIKGE